LAYSACKRLATSGSNLKNLFHEKCQNTGVNGEWMHTKVHVKVLHPPNASNGLVVQLVD